MKKLIISLVLVMAILPSFSNDSNDGIFDNIFNVPIEKLQKNPEEYRNKEIKIKGTVTKSVSILMQSGFIVKDKTGEIFVVVSGKMPPKINDIVSLKGKIVIVGSINDKNFIYFKENKTDNE
ncbi:hypothetical protein M0Q97_06840 [Candidatus Dojkabacteria bacterium]|jgi:hypothetical protein|nr:hypothetical protein [Candidatus Dojkabacteria bacterium]